MTRTRLLVLTAAFEGGALLLALVLGAVTATPPFGLARFSLSGVAAGLLVGVGMLFILVPLERASWGPLVRLREIVHEFAAAFFARATVVDLAIVSILAGVAEEALFRGVVQVALEGAIGTGPAIALASLVFGLAHPVTPLYVILATAIGILLGGLLALTGDLAAPIVAHAVYDFAALVWLVRPSGTARSG